MVDSRLVIIFKCIFILAFVFTGQNTYAKACLRYYGQTRSSFREFQKLDTAPLPKSIVELTEKWRHLAAEAWFNEQIVDVTTLVRKIKNHRVVIGDGAGFVIGIQYLKENSFILGEHIAATFVAKLVQRLYPKATIVDGDYSDINMANIEGRRASYRAWAANYPDRRIVFLGIHDFQIAMNHFNKVAVDMKDVKAANPGLAGIARGFFRNKLGVPEDKLIISLYFKQPEGSLQKDEAPSMGDILERLERSGKAPHIVFASGGRGESVHVGRAFGNRADGYEVMNLSDWSDKYDPKKKWIVLNDMRGYMPHILNISNLAVVSGPINIMEPTTANVPLIFFNNKSVITEYNPDAFNKMAEQAIATKGAWEVASISDFEMKIGNAMSNLTPIIPPYLLEERQDGDPNMVSPVDRLLQILIRKIAQGAELADSVKNEQRPRTNKSDTFGNDPSNFYN